MLSCRSTAVVFVLAAILPVGSGALQAQFDCNGKGIDDACDVACGPPRREAYQFATATRF
jgi:hypothetical protein